MQEIFRSFRIDSSTEGPYLILDREVRIDRTRMHKLSWPFHADAKFLEIRRAQNVSRDQRDSIAYWPRLVLW